ncbi:hypothetical protein CDD83_4754 [Cordyceps sp. RAO-2017]|nr:hypothetical protein CDD83_4754 [Cordyceps sp. RAO-2017]
MVHFAGVEYRAHTSCISEQQKYQGALYRDKNKKPKTKHHASEQPNMVPHPYVEDVGEDRDYEPWNDSVGHTEDERSPAEPPPEAPTPPNVAPDEHVNVFDFLVASGQTPNASNTNLPGDLGSLDVGPGSLVRYEYQAEGYLDPTSFMDSDEQPLVEYGSGPIPDSFTTPAPKSERRKTKDGEMKKDKKRKRPHIDIPADQVMTDAPPVLHSGLTGGLKSLMRPTLPPSPPDYSGGDVADNSPASPLKKTKHAKHAKNGHVGNSILDMITGGAKTKAHKKKSSSKKKHSHRAREPKEPKLIEFRPHSKDGKKDGQDGQMIIFKPRADAFLSFVTKGPDSERGCSMNKALKRYHRDRQASGSGVAKNKEEKELWKDLRLRRNDRGEIVIFSL